MDNIEYDELALQAKIPYKAKQVRSPFHINGQTNTLLVKKEYSIDSLKFGLQKMSTFNAHMPTGEGM